MFNRGAYLEKIKSLSREELIQALVREAELRNEAQHNYLDVVETIEKLEEQLQQERDMGL